MQTSREDIDNRFDYHRPPNPGVAKDHETIRSECKAAALTMLMLVPAGRERSLAITKLEEAMMWANAGIARHNSASLSDEERESIDKMRDPNR